MITLIQTKDKYDLKIDGQPFSNYNKTFRNIYNKGKANLVPAYQATKENPKIEEAMKSKKHQKTEEHIDIGILVEGFEKFDISRNKEVSNIFKKSNNNEGTIISKPSLDSQKKENSSLALNTSLPQNKNSKPIKFEIGHPKVSKTERPPQYLSQKVQNHQQEKELVKDLFDYTNTSGGLLNDIFCQNERNPYEEAVKKAKEDIKNQKYVNQRENLIKDDDIPDSKIMLIRNFSIYSMKK